jgi:hypothetical protein
MPGLFERKGKLWKRRCLIMKPEKMKCECCKKAPHQWVLVDTLDASVSYFVCMCCLPDLVTYNLKKKQLRNLAKSGHTANEFLLHEDFYDEDGNALQPMFGKGIEQFR